MALNSTPRRRLGVALGVVLTGVAAGLIGFTGIASAHTPKLSAECKGETTTLTVKLEAYNGQKKNTVAVTDNGAKLDDVTFKTSYDKKWDVPGNVDHSFTVKVVAGDDMSGQKGFSFEKTLDVKACVAPPETTTTTTTVDVPPVTTTTTEAPPTDETTSTTEVAPVVNTSTTSPAAPEVQNEGLAETGASIAWPLGIAGVLLIGGVVALFVVRRRGSSKA